MEKCYTYLPNATPRESKISIVDLIPIGREHAINRKKLTNLCIQHNLISPHVKDADRRMRKPLEIARLDYTILNLSNGGGYYRVSHNDLMDLQKYIRQEDNRAKAAFRNHSMARKLYEDYKADRIIDEVVEDGEKR